MKFESRPSAEPAGLKFLFRALDSRNYRLYFGGQSISLIGTWMQVTAMSWLVYRLTHSPFLLGLVGFTGQIPSFFMAPLAGVLIDRWNRHRVLLATQILAMLQAVILAVLVLTGLITIWYVLPLSFFLGLINSFDIPARQSFVVELVEDRKLLGNAIALNSSMVNMARLVGPTVAGIFIAVAGEGMCFLVNAASYIAVIASLLLMRVSAKSAPPKKARVWQDFKEGFTYASGFTPIRSILLLLALVSLVGVPYMVLMPIFAKDILHGGPYTLGLLMGASGMGALSGAMYLASRKSVIGLSKMIALASALFGVGLIAFSLSRSFYLSMVLLVMAGFGMMVQMASSNTIIQTIVDDDKRGRVMSFFTMAFIGMTPFGSLLAGCLASHVGAPNTLRIGGACCLVGAALFGRRLGALKAVMGPIYVRMGILQEYRGSNPR